MTVHEFGHQIATFGKVQTFYKFINCSFFFIVGLLTVVNAHSLTKLKTNPSKNHIVHLMNIVYRKFHMSEGTSFIFEYFLIFSNISNIFGENQLTLINFEIKQVNSQKDI